MKIQNIHAHFDDFEFTAGGLFTIARQRLGAGFTGQVIVSSDGKAGHQYRTREETGRVRLAEQQESARIGGYDFRLLRLPDEVRQRYDVSSLRFVAHGAAPCAPAVKRRMIEWWGPVVYEYYGATETGVVVWHGSEEALRKPGTVGRPVSGAILRIVDEQGRDVDQGEVGEIYLRGPHLSDFTYNNDDAKRREVALGDLVTVGDIGYLDADGFLFLCDRKRDMIISGGVNIYPAEIESALIQMPGVRDCAVFGVPDEEFGEQVCAYVEPVAADSLDAGQVRAWLSGHVARYKVPKIVEFSAALPREDSGKIFKRKLRAPYWERAGRSI